MSREHSSLVHEARQLRVLLSPLAWEPIAALVLAMRSDLQVTECGQVTRCGQDPSGKFQAFWLFRQPDAPWAAQMGVEHAAIRRCGFRIALGINRKEDGQHNMRKLEISGDGRSTLPLILSGVGVFVAGIGAGAALTLLVAPRRAYAMRSIVDRKVKHGENWIKDKLSAVEDYILTRETEVCDRVKGPDETSKRD